MKKRVIGPTPREKRDYRLSISVGSIGKSGFNFGMFVTATFKGYGDKEFLLGGMYGIKNNELLREGRLNQEFIELFPFEGAPKLYNEELLEQHHVIELCEKFGVSHPVTNGIKIILSKEHVFVFVKVSNGEPSKELLQALKAFCDDKGIEWLPAEQIEAKYPDLFEG